MARAERIREDVDRPWATVIVHASGHLEAFGPYEEQNTASRVALKALDAISASADAQDGRFAGTEDAIPVELRRWPGRDKWGRA